MLFIPVIVWRMWATCENALSPFQVIGTHIPVIEEDPWLRRVHHRQGFVSRVGSSETVHLTGWPAH